jgi:6-phosphogluconolactonase
MRKLHIYTTAEETIAALADFFIETAKQTIAAKGICNISLSGGSSPKKLYELLASTSYKSLVQWEKLYFFFGDERYVKSNDSSYNGLMVSRALFEPLNISEEQIFFIDTSLNPEEAAARYSAAVIDHFNNQPIRFDVVLLGLGDDAHTASLFPFTAVLKEKDKLVSEVYLKEQKTYRITMTAPLINSAHHIAFLVYGASKAEAVYNVLEGEKNEEYYPAQLINPVGGNVHWFLDKAAVSLLKNGKQY